MALEEGDIGVTEHPILFSAPMVLAILAGKKTQTRRIVNLDRLRVRLRSAMTSDLADVLPESMTVRAKKGVYRAQIHPQGAVSAVVDGRAFGMKPGEFDFECPYASGTTDYRSGAKCWQIDVPRGQHLWVKESWATLTGNGVRIVYRADGEDPRTGWGDRAPENRPPMRWTSPYFLKRRDSRITLEVVSVRIERLHAITEEDAHAEGATLPDPSKVCAICPCETQVEEPGPHIATCPWRDVDVDPIHGPIVDAFARGWNEINGKRAAWSSNPFVWVVSFRRVDAKEKAG